MRGQTQAVTAVLITGITVAAVASAYVFGTPLLEKQQSEVEAAGVEGEIFKVKEAIQEVREGNVGSVESVEIDMRGGSVSVKEDLNFVEFDIPEGGERYTNQWTMIDGTSLQDLSFGDGSYGQLPQDQHGVIAARGSQGSATSARYRIEYRNMRTEELGEPRIKYTNLTAPMQTEAEDSTEIVFTNEGVTTDQYEVETGQTLPRDVTTITVEFR